MMNRSGVFGLLLLLSAVLALVLGGCASDQSELEARVAELESELDAATSSTTSTTSATTTTAEASTTTTRPTTTTTRATTTTEPEVAEPEIIDSGATSTADGNVVWAAIVENSNREVVLTDVWIDVELVDADGRIVATETDRIEILLPNSRAAIAGRAYDVDAPAETLSFYASWDEMDMTGQTWGTWSQQEVAFTTGRYGKLELSAEIRSTFDETMEDVQVVWVYRDEDEKITGGDWTYIDRVYNDKWVVADTTSYDGDEVEVASVEFYPSG
jgi:hypothetical protein